MSYLHFQDNSISLLQYLVRYYVKNVDPDSGTEKSKLPLPEPSDVTKASLVNFEEAEQDIQKLKVATKSIFHIIFTEKLNS